MHTGEDVQILTFKRNHLNTTGGFKFGKCVNTLLINRHNCKEKNRKQHQMSTFKITANNSNSKTL